MPPAAVGPPPLLPPSAPAHIQAAENALRNRDPVGSPVGVACAFGPTSPQLPVHGRTWSEAFGGVVPRDTGRPKGDRARDVSRSSIAAKHRDPATRSSIAAKHLNVQTSVKTSPRQVASWAPCRSPRVVASGSAWGAVARAAAAWAAAAWAAAA